MPVDLLHKQRPYRLACAELFAGASVLYTITAEQRMVLTSMLLVWSSTVAELPIEITLNSNDILVVHGSTAFTTDSLQVSTFLPLVEGDQLNVAMGPHTAGGYALSGYLAETLN